MASMEDTVIKDPYAKLIDEKLRYIHENRERLLEAWVAETGCLPSDAMLITQECGDGTTRMWIERKPEDVTKWRACAARDAPIVAGSCARCGTTHGRLV
jgi:hypothetical protein